MDSELLKFICANQGAVDADDVMFNLFPGASADKVIANKHHFVLHSSNGRQKVVAKTSLKLCRVRDCFGTCEQLHLCKNFLFTGLCQRRVCSFCHDLNFCYNQRLLKQHELEGLNRAELSTLMLQSDNSLLPPICYKYNTGNDEFGQCQSGIACAKLHICKKYLSQDCSCSKTHDFYAPQPLKSLYDKGVPHSLISSLRSIYANNEALRISMKHKTEICMYYIKGYCKHENQCIKLHDKMPYRWQVQEGDRWTALPHNETIEKDYCDPKNTHSSSIPLVDFYTMTCRQNVVRRLSTPNSLVKPDFIHTTEWLWYWQDEFGRWKLYGADSQGHGSADVNSSKLEQRFLDNDKTVDFTAGSQSYSLSFQDMIQTNKHYRTKKLVSRRPRFVSAEDVETKKVRKPSNFTSVPDNWDKTQISQTGVSRVALNRTSDEYQKVKALFCSTMQGFNIVTIERIQNKALWEVFQWQKNLMKNNSGGSDVTERQLFHGTDSNHVKAICLKNFDWRICGSHGTVYGKGSYFARDATYSHSYTGNTVVRAMFVSRVLVGSYTKGVFSYVRPPSKDGGDVNFYDSCVDNVLNPSIFVVFEKHQIYPEYLIQYRSADLLDDFVHPAPAPAPTNCVIA
ncbi:protein mono-ADP-ribosyltransferase PARP12-like [Nematolebias whitei]|uniref:protein mono-ADP-ribosyltransferase PARP12-like n=1 Tax=Nematolebias whitei TaxID=451745 RepID=UPI00189BC4B3|nr:protein mono-ADP-ribosyltransferase PARP12-like [Nematolebias whitei]